jgi:type III secretion protein J
VVDISMNVARTRRNGIRGLRLAAAVQCALLLAACNMDLYNNLDQQDANEMVALLIRHGIPTGRTVDKNGHITVSVDERAFAGAMRILDENALPRKDFKTLGDVFKMDGIVPTRMQERAQMIFAQSQQLERTISSIDGVLSARVQLDLPENDPLRQQSNPPVAAVLVRYRADMPNKNILEPQVKQLVANSVAGLSYDKIAVALNEVTTSEKTDSSDPGLESFLGVWVQRDSLSRVVTVFYGLVAMILALSGALGVIVWRQRQLPYPLKPP